MEFEIHRAPGRRSLRRDADPRTPRIASFRRPPGCPPVSHEESSDLAPPLVLRDTQEDFAEDPKEVRTLRPELVLRDVPGKSVQRRRDPQRRRRRRRRRRHLRRPRLQPPRHEVVRVARPPRRLRLLPTRRLALRRRAHLLPITDAGVGLEPATADPARALPTHPRASRRCAATTPRSPSRPPTRRRPTSAPPPGVDYFSRPTAPPLLDLRVDHFSRADPGQFSRALKFFAPKPARVQRAACSSRSRAPPGSHLHQHVDEAVLAAHVRVARSGRHDDEVDGFALGRERNGERRRRWCVPLEAQDLRWRGDRHPRRNPTPPVSPASVRRTCLGVPGRSCCRKVVIVPLPYHRSCGGAPSMATAIDSPLKTEPPSIAIAVPPPRLA